MARGSKTQNANPPKGKVADWQKSGWEDGASHSEHQGKQGKDEAASPTPSEDTDAGGLVVTFGGEATAVGTETLAEGDLFSRVVDRGHVTTAYGTAEFTATAQAAEGETAFASADTFFDFAGADFVMVFETTSSSQKEKGGQTIATETATLQFVAIDIENWDSPKGPVVVEATSASQLQRGLDGWGCWGRGNGWSGWCKPAELEGNVATLNVDSEAAGTNTLADADVSLLTVEDQLSTAAGIVTTGVA
jgi:hypothetical protein